EGRRRRLGRPAPTVARNPLEPGSFISWETGRVARGLTLSDARLRGGGVALSRRSVLAQAVAVVAAAATGACTPASGASPIDKPTQAPPSDRPIASWTLTGGFTTAGVRALRPPRVVIYSDGEAIADAAYRTRLDLDDLQSLLNHLASDLRAPS